MSTNKTFRNYNPQSYIGVINEMKLIQVTKHQMQKRLTRVKYTVKERAGRSST